MSLESRTLGAAVMRGGNGGRGTWRTRRLVFPFLIGTAVGGVAGIALGALLSEQMAHIVGGLVGVIDRRLSDADRDELRFELLLQ